MLEARARGAGRAGQRRQRGHGRRVPSRRGQAVPVACSACSGAPAWAARSCSTAAVGGPRRGRRDRPHVRESWTARLPVRAARLHGGLRRPRRDGGPRAREGRRRRQDALFKIMEEKGKPRLSSGVWARALERDDKLAHQIIDRAVEALGAGIASALNLLDVEAVIIGGGLGPARRALRRADPRRDDAAPLRRLPPAGRCSPRSATSAARSARRCSPRSGCRARLRPATRRPISRATVAAPSATSGSPPPGCTVPPASHSRGTARTRPPGRRSVPRRPCGATP